jgi:hypothetical protein
MRAMQRGGVMFGSGNLNLSCCSSFLGGRIVIFGWYTWGAVVQIPRCNVDHYVKCDRLCQPRSSFNVVVEDTGDVYTRATRDVQLTERKGILDRTNHSERPGVSASHGPLKGCQDVQDASHTDEV